MDDSQPAECPVCRPVIFSPKVSVMKRVICALIVLTTALLSGCGSKNSMESFVRQDVDLGFVTRLAVLPFENNSQDSYVAERVRDITITQILASGQFDVVDKGIVDSALREEAVDLKKIPLDEALLQRLGQRLDVQAFLFGTIDHYEIVQREAMTFPELSLTLRLVDINTGMIFWQACATRSGDSFGKRIFGFSSDDTFAVSIKLVRAMLRTINEAPPPAPEAADAAPAVDAAESDDAVIDGDVDESESVFIDATGDESDFELIEEGTEETGGEGGEVFEEESFPE